jgi:hypothetical protein
MVTRAPSRKYERHDVPKRESTFAGLARASWLFFSGPDLQ